MANILASLALTGQIISITNFTTAQTQIKANHPTMSSLQEQLLKAGLVDEKKAKQAEREKQKRSKQARKSSGKSGGGKADPLKAAVNKRKAEQAERDRKLAEQRKQAREQKEIAAQVKQLIETNKVDRSQGEIPYSFVYRNKVKKIYIGETEKNLLIEGRLVIATMVINNVGRRFELVPKDVAEKIRQRDADSVIELDDKEKTDPAADDPYADYQVPDDLIW